MHKRGTTYWWLPDGYSRTAAAVLPTIREEPRASEQVFQLRHPAFISWNDVRNSGEEALVFVDGTSWMVWLCGPWLTSWRRDLSRSSGRTETCSRTLSCHFAVCLQCHAGRHSALPAVSVHPASRVGISGAEMISQAEGSTAVKVSVVPRSRQHETTSGRRERIGSNSSWPRPWC